MAKYKFNRKNIKKLVGIILITISTICFIPLFTGLIGFLKHFLLGTFGLFSYPLFILTFIIGIALLNKRKYILPAKYLVLITCAIISLLAIIQMAIMHNFQGGFFEFLASCYTRQLTPGGIIVGIFISPIKYTLNNIGVYVVFSITLITFSWLIIDYLIFVKKSAENGVVITKKQKKEEIDTVHIKQEKAKEKKGEWLIDSEGNLIGREGEEVTFVKNEEKPKHKEKAKIVLDGKIEEELDEKNISAKKKLGLVKSSGVVESSENFKLKNNMQESRDPLEKKLLNNEISRKDYILTPPKFLDVVNSSRVSSFKDENSDFLDDVNKKILEIKNESNEIKQPEKVIHDETSNFMLFKNRTENNKNVKDEKHSQDFVDLEKDDSEENDLFIDKIIEGAKANSNLDININTTKQEKTPVQLEIAGAEKKHEEQIKSQKNFYKKPPTYVKPPVDFLKFYPTNNTNIQSTVQESAQKLEESLLNFNIPAKVVRIVIGPAVTRYELEMPVGVSVKKILNHQDDIAYSIASNGNIRIEAPILGRSAVGIEVPNEEITTIGLKEIISSKEFAEAKAPLTFALGKDINGDVKLCNLAKMPHLLVAGTTGSGKSVCLNSIIISLIYRMSPEDLRLILIDPKRVEFSIYDGLPHLLQPRIISEIDKAINALNWAIVEMERRFSLFQDVRARNLEEYNNSEVVLSGENDKLPLIVIIIDELADFMLQAKKDLEDKIARLAAKARACGIHLILATQRPSVNVITGTIKANFPSRIAFAVMSYVDSKTILDQAGAEKLLGKGDMLYFPNDRPEPTRIQGCFVSTKEVEQVVEFVKANNPSEYDAEIGKALSASGKQNMNLDGSGSSNFDELLPLALKYIIENGQASITMIQRKFEVGYPRAARILDQMVEAGYVSVGSKPRSVYITMEQWEELFGGANG